MWDSYTGHKAAGPSLIGGGYAALDIYLHSNRRPYPVSVGTIKIKPYHIGCNHYRSSYDN